MIKNFLIVFGTIILVSLGITTGIALITSAFDKTERAECERWAEQAHELEGFYLTAAEAAQCAHHGIAVDAPTK